MENIKEYTDKSRSSSKMIVSLNFILEKCKTYFT